MSAGYNKTVSAVCNVSILCCLDVYPPHVADGGAVESVEAACLTDLTWPGTASVSRLLTRTTVTCRAGVRPGPPASPLRLPPGGNTYTLTHYSGPQLR